MKHEINDQIDCETKPLLDFFPSYTVCVSLVVLCMYVVRRDCPFFFCFLVGRTWEYMGNETPRDICKTSQ